MKTQLTLKAGSFFFLNTVHLLRNTPQEVDLATLNAEELKAVRLYLASGHLVSDQEIPAEVFEPVGTPSEQPTGVYDVTGEHVPDGREGFTGDGTYNEIQDSMIVAEEMRQNRMATLRAELEKLTVRQLKDKVTEAGLETEATTKNDLIEFLVNAQV